MSAREVNGMVRIVVCRRGGRSDVAFIPDVTGLCACYHCGHDVLLIGNDTTLVAAGTIDAICLECAIELAKAHDAFRPEHRIERSEL